MVRELNKKFKAQKAKTDILCNDMVAAHTHFAHHLEETIFAAELYKSLLGLHTQSQIFDAAARSFNSVVPDLNVAVYMHETDSFEFHKRPFEAELTVGQHQIESCFTQELSSNICQSNEVAGLDELMEMSYQENFTVLRDLSVAAIPLLRFGPPMGFILIYRQGTGRFTKKQLEMFASVSEGLAKALASCNVPLVH